MKNTILFVLLIPTIVLSQPLPDFYHNYQEVMDSLETLAGLYPNVLMIEEIGISQQDSIPIYSVKLSDNVQTTEDEPRLLFIGEIHAEENIGVELVLEVITEYVTHWNQPPYVYYINSAELYFIPSLNPEGFNVVMEGLDASYRKNKRDNIGDGVFRYMAELGYDTSGVDLNRNFALNWVHGDSLFQAGHVELYDYYRGPGPFSENETKALKAFAEEKDFCFSVIYHQSRQGGVSENVIFPWEWTTDKKSPDYDVIGNIGLLLSQEMHLLSNPSQPYAAVGAVGYVGAAQDWWYAELGCYAYTIETSSIQPSDSTILNWIVDDNKNGIEFLIQRAIGYSIALPQVGQLTGKITNSLTGLPITADIQITGRESSLVKPRTSDEQFGRYRLILNSGQYTLHISKPWFASLDTTVSVSQNYITIKNFVLTPLPVVEAQGTIWSYPAMEPIDGAEVHFWGNVDTVITTNNGEFFVNLPAGVYSVRIDAAGYISDFVGTINIVGNTEIHRELSQSQLLFSDGFENGLNNWRTGGTGVWSIDLSDSYSGGASVTDSVYYMYLDNTEKYIEFDADLSEFTSAHIEFRNKYYFEPEYDFGFVEVSANGGGDWTTIAAYSLQNVDWYKEILSLTSFCGNNVTIRFTLESDETLSDPGWNIDDVAVYGSNNDSGIAEVIIPDSFRLHKPYPNPFNGRILIKYSLPVESAVKISVYNIAGQKTGDVFSGIESAGTHISRWNAEALSSGIYFISIEAGNFSSLEKVILLK